MSKYRHIVFIFVAVVIALGGLTIHEIRAEQLCVDLKQQHTILVKDANTCNTDQDCVYVAGPHCCSCKDIAINKQFQPEADAILEQYNQECRRECEHMVCETCISPPPLVCIAGKCKPKICDVGVAYRHTGECYCPEGTRADYSDDGGEDWFFVCVANHSLEQ